MYRLGALGRVNRLLALLCSPEWQVTLDNDQLARICYVLNIHASLRVLFDNPANLYSFMAMANFNKGFDGRSPLEVIPIRRLGYSLNRCPDIGVHFIPRVSLPLSFVTLTFLNHRRLLEPIGKMPSAERKALVL